jgi:hypothetical protein
VDQGGVELLLDKTLDPYGAGLVGKGGCQLPQEFFRRESSSELNIRKER